MSFQSRRQEAKREAAIKYKPYTLVYDDDEDEFLPAPKKKAGSRPTASRVASSDKDKKKPKTTSEPLPPPTINLGMPTREQYKAIEDEYIQSLHPRKREKALLSQAMFDMIWDVLHDPLRSRVGSPQFRWWVRKMFVLSHVRPAGSDDAAGTPVVLHEDRPVALKEQIYEVLCYCHDLSNHGGRDKTTMVIRAHYSWVPKELIAQFVKVCPTCIFKKTGSKDLAHALGDVGNSPLIKMEGDEAPYQQSFVGAQEPAGGFPQLPNLPEPGAVPVLVKIESTTPTPDWSGVPLPPVHAPSASQTVPATAHSSFVPPLDPWMSDAYGSRNDWSSGSAPSHSDMLPDAYSQARPGLEQTGNYSQAQSYQDLPPIRRLHSADDAFAYNGNPRITLPPLQQVLSDGGLDTRQGTMNSAWNPAPPMHAWNSGSPGWNAPLLPQLADGFNFASPLNSPSRRWYTSLDEPSVARFNEHEYAPSSTTHIDPTLLGPADDYLSLAPGPMSDSPLRPTQVHGRSLTANPDVNTLVETPRRSRRTMSVQSLVVGSSSMSSLSLRADGEGGEGEQTTPVRRGVLENGRSPGGSIYLHPSRFLLSAAGRQG